MIAAATLSDRYISDRKQPDKSIDLIDEACSRLRLEQESKPEIIWKVERDLLTKQIEMTALADEDDKKSIARRTQVEHEVSDLKNKLNGLNFTWQAEKEELERAKTIQERLDRAKRDLEQARRQGDFSTAGKLQHGTIPQLEEEMHELETFNTTDQGRNTHKMLAEYVSADAIATCVARHTGIPVSKISGSEAEKLLDMEKKLEEVNNLLFITCLNSVKRCNPNHVQPFI